MLIKLLQEFFIGKIIFRKVKIKNHRGDQPANEYICSLFLAPTPFSSQIIAC